MDKKPDADKIAEANDMVESKPEPTKAKQPPAKKTTKVAVPIKSPFEDEGDEWKELEELRKFDHNALIRGISAHVPAALVTHQPLSSAINYDLVNPSERQFVLYNASYILNSDDEKRREIPSHIF